MGYVDDSAWKDAAARPPAPGAIHLEVIETEDPAGAISVARDAETGEILGIGVDVAAEHPTRETDR